MRDSPRRIAFDYRLIGSTGISEPLPVAQAFTFGDDQGRSLADISRLDTMVTVVDALNLPRELDAADRLADRGESAGEGDERTVADLLADQIEFADVVVLSKCNLAGEGRARTAEAGVRALNRRARIIRADHRAVDLAEVLDTGLFDVEEAQQSAAWIAELNADHTPETEERGVGSFVYRARRAFHPARFMEYIRAVEWPGGHPLEGILLAGHAPPLRLCMVAGRIGVQLRAHGALVGNGPPGGMAGRARDDRHDRDGLGRPLGRPPPGNRVHRTRPGPPGVTDALDACLLSEDEM